MDTIQTLLFVFAVFIVIYIFLFRPFQVNGDSMYPNFHDKEYILTNIITLRFNRPKLGDIVVFRAPPNQEKDYIKRIIGIPGDQITFKDGEVYINQKRLNEEKYLKASMKTYGGSFAKDGETISIPNDSYFVMGDNRLESSDSREWGFVPIGLIIGKSFFAYWPLKEMGVITNPYN